MVYESGRGGALTPAYSAGLKRNGNVSLSSDHSTRMAIADVCRCVRGEGGHAGPLHGRVERVAALARIQLITGLKCRRQLDAPHRRRGPRFAISQIRHLGYRAACERLSGYAARCHIALALYVGLIKRFGYRTRSSLLPCNRLRVIWRRWERMTSRRRVVTIKRWRADGSPDDPFFSELNWKERGSIMRFN